MTTDLTTTDLDLLATCEETIARGLQTFEDIMNHLSAAQFQQLLVAAQGSVFAPFWLDMLPAMRATGLPPAKILAGGGDLARMPEEVRDAVARLRRAECPFARAEAMRRSFRMLVRRAGIEEAELARV